MSGSFKTGSASVADGSKRESNYRMKYGSALNADTANHHEIPTRNRVTSDFYRQEMFKLNFGANCRTVFKSWITWERSLRFKYSATI